MRPRGEGPQLGERLSYAQIRSYQRDDWVFHYTQEQPGVDSYIIDTVEGRVGKRVRRGDYVPSILSSTDDVPMDDYIQKKFSKSAKYVETVSPDRGIFHGITPLLPYPPIPTTVVYNGTAHHVFVDREGELWHEDDHRPGVWYRYKGYSASAAPDFMNDKGQRIYTGTTPAVHNKSGYLQGGTPYYSSDKLTSQPLIMEPDALERLRKLEAHRRVVIEEAPVVVTKTATRSRIEEPVPQSIIETRSHSKRRAHKRKVVVKHQAMVMEGPAGPVTKTATITQTDMPQTIYVSQSGTKHYPAHVEEGEAGTTYHGKVVTRQQAVIEEGPAYPEAKTATTSRTDIPQSETYTLASVAHGAVPYTSTSHRKLKSVKIGSPRVYHSKLKSVSLTGLKKKRKAPPKKKKASPAKKRKVAAPKKKKAAPKKKAAKKRKCPANCKCIHCVSVEVNVNGKQKYRKTF